MAIFSSFSELCVQNIEKKYLKHVSVFRLFQGVHHWCRTPTSDASRYGPNKRAPHIDKTEDKTRLGDEG